MTLNSVMNRLVPKIPTGSTVTSPSWTHASSPQWTLHFFNFEEQEAGVMCLDRKALPTKCKCANPSKIR